MIRRKKKIIRLKNPGWELEKIEVPEDYIPPKTVSNQLIKLIYKTITNQAYQARDFSNLLCLWNQGNYCFDCSELPVPYGYCECEICSECEEKYCICPIKTNDEVYKTTWEFAKLVLSKQQLKVLKNWLCKVRKSISNSTDLKKPSYPKYKKIAKELFRLD